MSSYNSYFNIFTRVLLVDIWTNSKYQNIWVCSVRSEDRQRNEEEVARRPLKEELAWLFYSARSVSRDVGCAWHQFQEPNALLDEEQSSKVFIRQCKMAALLRVMKLQTWSFRNTVILPWGIKRDNGTLPRAIWQKVEIYQQMPWTLRRFLLGQGKTLLPAHPLPLWNGYRVRWQILPLPPLVDWPAPPMCP